MQTQGNLLLQELESACRLEGETDLSPYQTDPLAYAASHLRTTLTPDQEAMLRSVRDNRYTAVMASHAIGKTHLASVAANWWYDCWAEHIVYVTAPTWPQALGLTFKGIKSLRRSLRLPGTILDTGLIRDEDKSREGAHFIRALNAESGEGFQGEHSAPILIILEEAVGVPGYIWEAAGGLMTHPENRLLAIANPTDEATQFGAACESAAYHVLSISALDHPNIAAELAASAPPYPKAVRLQWLYEMLVGECEVVSDLTDDAFEWWAPEVVQGALQGRPLGPGAARVFYQPTAYFQGRVLGQFPTQADQQVIPRGWLLNLPEQPLPEDGLPEVGCDTARFGDDRTTVFGRWGPCALSGRELRQMDSFAIVAACKDETGACAAVAGCEPKRIPIKIDVTGGLGTGPFDILKAEGYAVVAVNSSERAKDPEAYPNVRSELWFDTRGRVKDRRLDLSRLPLDLRRRLIRELSTPKYQVRGGRKVVQEKAETKKALSASPDLADGFNLAFYQPATFDLGPGAW